MRHHSVLAIMLFACLILSGTSALQAGWTHNGAPICTTGGDQKSPQIIPDGEGGAFIVWDDHRTLSDIYAQRVDNMGRRQWLESGLLVCQADNTQMRVQIVSDGAGGFIAVWIDSRSVTNYDIYAQRVGGDGSILWTGTAVEVCAAAGDQDWPMICSDNAGGCIITWQDKRVSQNSDIYAQRLDANGTPLWTADGVVVCTADSIQTMPQIVADGSGGAVIVWSDYRDDGDIYAQKLNSHGTVQWLADGAPVCIVQSSVQYQYKIATDDAGGAFVTWSDRQGSSLDIRIQRIDSSGNVVFDPSGRILCNAFGTQREPAITADGSGGAIVTWVDFRNGSVNSDVYAHRVDSAGNLLWTETNGEPVCNSDGQVFFVSIMSDSDGGAIISWCDTRDAAVSSYDVYAQRIDSDGVCLWHADGDSLCKAFRSEAEIDLATDGYGGAIVAWRDDRTVEYNIYAQRITAGGGFVATTVSYFECVPSDEGLRLEWSISHECMAVDFIVSRRELPAGDFVELTGRPATGDGFEFAFTDDSAEPGSKYLYRVDIVEEGSRNLLFETGAVSTPATALCLYQNNPNPFNPATRIAWYLDERSHVRLEVFDAAGRRVATLVDGVREAGDHEVVWNGTGTERESVASGVYLYRLTAGKKTLTRKAVLLR